LGARVLEHYDPSTEFGKVYNSYTKFNRNFPFEIEELEPIFGNFGTKGISKFLANSVGLVKFEKYFSGMFPIELIDAKLRVIKEG